MNKKGILVVVSGFAGSGKGTVMKELLNRYDNYSLSVSATTRPPRPGETNGKEYFFNSYGEFEEMINNGEFIEHAKYVNNYYGTPKKYVREQLDLGNDVILEIEIQGALQIKSKYPDTLLLFLTPPSVDTLITRLVDRGTEDIATVQARLRRACEEVEFVDKYDYILVNNDINICVSEVHSIIQNEHHRTFRNSEFLKDIRREFALFAKGE